MTIRGLLSPEVCPSGEREFLVLVKRLRIDIAGRDPAMIDVSGHTQIQLRGIACPMLEPGAHISRKAVPSLSWATRLVTRAGEAAAAISSPWRNALGQAPLAGTGGVGPGVVAAGSTLEACDPICRRRALEALQRPQRAPIREQVRVGIAVGNEVIC